MDVVIATVTLRFCAVCVLVLDDYSMVL